MRPNCKEVFSSGLQIVEPPRATKIISKTSEALIFIKKSVCKGERVAP